MGSNGPAWGRRRLELTSAREDFGRAQRQRDAAAIKVWNIARELGEPMRPSPTIRAAINGGYGFLRVRCAGCKTTAFIALTTIRRPGDTPLWQLEDGLSCHRCSDGGRMPAPRARLERVTRSDRDLGWANP